MTFYPDTHSYIHNGIKYTSMTSLLKKYEPFTDWDKMANTYIKRRTREQLVEDCYNKYGGDYDKWCKFDFTPENIKKVWRRAGDIASEVGTAYHLWKETEYLQRGDAIETPIVDGKKEALPLDELGEYLYPELIIWDEDCLVSGQSDLPDFRYGGGLFSISDHKTSKEVKATNEYNKFFTGPINHIPYNDYYKFALQLTGYAVMLENHGYECSEIWVNHVLFEDRKAGKVSGVNRIDLPLLRDEIYALFEHFKKRKK